jgi:hypothetical protein
VSRTNETAAIQRATLPKHIFCVLVLRQPLLNEGGEPLQQQHEAERRHGERLRPYDGRLRRLFYIEADGAAVQQVMWCSGNTVTNHRNRSVHASLCRPQPQPPCTSPIKSRIKLSIRTWLNKSGRWRRGPGTAREGHVRPTQPCHPQRQQHQRQHTDRHRRSPPYITTTHRIAASDVVGGGSAGSARHHDASFVPWAILFRGALEPFRCRARGTA